jgi:hypothetical protein
VSKTHYETVGAAPAASPDQVRRAYLKRARQLHPDQFVDRPAAERARAERRMQDLNAAWSVLSDAGARRAYDLELGRMVTRGTGRIVGGRADEWQPFDPPRPAAPTPKPGPVVADERDMEIRGTARLLRPGLLLAVLVSLVALIVIATMATGNGDSDGGRSTPLAEPTGVPIACIDLPTAETVPCGGHDAVVWSIVGGDETCPSDLTGFYRQGVGGQFCVTIVD